MTYPNRFTRPRPPQQPINLPSPAQPQTKAPEPRPQPTIPPSDANVLRVYQDTNNPSQPLTEHRLQTISEPELPVAEPEPEPPQFVQPAPKSDRSTKLERHSRKCVVCQHPEREAIEEAYIHWATPGSLMDEFRLPSRLSIYRHALATGLSQRRRRRMVYSLELIVEQAGKTQASADTVIRAVRACSRLDEDGRWIDPPRRVIHEHRSAVATLPPVPAQLREASAPHTITIELAQQNTAEDAAEKRREDF
jgi:hypothetical protein